MILDHIRDRAAPVNLAPMPLFVQCWNLLGCVKAAPSNKAARCISGKTMHTAMELTGGPLSESSQTGAEYQSANATPLLDLSPEFLIREQAEDVPDSVGYMYEAQGRGFIHDHSAIYAIYRTIYASKPPIQKAVER